MSDTEYEVTIDKTSPFYNKVITSSVICLKCKKEHPIDLQINFYKHEPFILEAMQLTNGEMTVYICRLCFLKALLK